MHYSQIFIIALNNLTQNISMLIYVNIILISIPSSESIYIYDTNDILCDLVF